MMRVRLRILWAQFAGRSLAVGAVLVGLMSAAVYLGAQTPSFPRDSQLTASRRPQQPASDDSLQRDIAELLASMRGQQVTNALTARAVEDLTGRVARIEAIKPDVVVLRVDSLESAATKINALLLSILGALLLNFWSSWSKRPGKASAP